MRAFTIIAVIIAIVGVLVIWNDWFVANDAGLQTIATVVTILAGLVSVVGVVAQFFPRTKDSSQAKPLIEKTTPIKDLQRTYYRDTIRECERLELDKVAGFDTGISRVTLPDIYTDQHVLPTTRSRGKDKREAGFLDDRIGGSSEPMALIEAVARPENRHVIVLGPVGSGKSSFVNVLSWKVANSQIGEDVEDLPEVFKRRPLVRVLLRNVAREFQKTDNRDEKGGTPKASAEVLWQEVRSQLTRSVGEPQADALYSEMKTQLTAQGVFLFDGLDEVPEASGWRHDILDAIDRLIGQLDKDARVIVTSRPYAYARPEQQLENLPVLSLLDMTPELIDAFIMRWYKKMAPAKGWDEDVAGRRGEDLSGILKEREYLHPIAGRPLLLTLIASLHSSRGVLPHKRAELYKESLNLLLQRWHQRLLDQEYPMEHEILELLRQPPNILLAALEDLAYRVQRRQGKETRAGKTPADIEDVEAAGMFNRHLENPQALLDFLDNNSGILVGQGSGYFRFVHRSFQEYLAAGHLARQKDGISITLQHHVAEAPDWWREVFLLAVSRFSEPMDTAKGMVENLLLTGWEDQPYDRRNAWAPLLAGLGLRELRLPEEQALYPFMDDTIQRTARSLVEVVEGAALPAGNRLEAGDVLAELGDPRRGVCGIVVNRGIELPEIDWVEIHAGEFEMGSDENDPDAYKHEKPVFRWNPGRFKISRYPITNRQYGCFLEADGYANDRYWEATSAGLAWRHGANPDLDALDFGKKEWKDAYKEHLEARIDRQRPRWWEDRKLGLANRPVIGVTWYEALAFCRWLSEQLGEEITLPTEAQWERAARGPGSSRYPWGNDWRVGYCNSQETGYQQTCAVGLFPEGQSSTREELMDMGGNVWEWTTTLWGNKLDEPEFVYPYREHQDRENLDTKGFRIVRGGSWYDDHRDVRSSCRFRLLPVYDSDVLGFRVVVSLANSGD